MDSDIDSVIDSDIDSNMDSDIDSDIDTDIDSDIDSDIDTDIDRARGSKRRWQKGLKWGEGAGRVDAIGRCNRATRYRDAIW